MTEWGSSMKKQTIAMAAWSILFTLCTTASAHVGAAIYPIYELPTSDLPDLHDGTLADWDEVLAGASLTHSDFEAQDVGEGAPVDPGDLAYQIYLAWHGSSQRLYAAMERVDDVYVNEYEGAGSGDIWKHDGFELMVDGDHSGGPYQGFGDEFSSEARRRLINSQAQQYLAVSEAADGHLLVLAELMDGAHKAAERMQVTVPPYADAGGFVLSGSPSLSVIEMYVTPFDALEVAAPDLSQRSQLYAERIIGFQISIPDYDSEPSSYHGFYTLAGQSGAWRTADLFVDGVLLPCEGGDCGSAPEPVSAVEVDSWGRIKAGLR